MVIRHSINDWYANAEGAAESSSYDWQNDDRTDRGVDSWLDRAVAGSRRSAPALRTGGGFRADSRAGSRADSRSGSRAGAKPARRKAP